MCARMFRPSMCAWRPARLDSMHAAVCDRRSVRRRDEHARLSTRTKEQTRIVLASVEEGEVVGSKKSAPADAQRRVGSAPAHEKDSFALE
eukprot:7228235-Prymnesium_polylepis.1